MNPHDNRRSVKSEMTAKRVHPTSQPQPYRMRLRAAWKALCWWKPWYSYYAWETEMLAQIDHAYGEGMKAVVQPTGPDPTPVKPLDWDEI